LRNSSACSVRHVSPVPLNEVKIGGRVRVVSLAAGHGLRGRLCAMGVVSGSSIEVLQNVRHGPIIIALEGCRVVMGRGMAKKVLVE